MGEKKLLEIDRQAADVLQQLNKQVIKNAFEGQCPDLTFTVGSQDHYQQLVLGEWMSLVVLAGTDFHMVFKVHYSTKTAENLLLKGRMRRRGYTERAVHDFMREICSICAGHFKFFLETVGLNSGVSLPVVTRGFDEVYFRRRKVPGPLDDCWFVSSSAGRIVCSLSVDAFDEQISVSLARIDTGAGMAILPQIEVF